MYKVGDNIKIHDIEGHISKIDATTVLIDTTTGQVVVPAKEFNEHKSVVILEFLFSKFTLNKFCFVISLVDRIA